MKKPITEEYVLKHEPYRSIIGIFLNFGIYRPTVVVSNGEFKALGMLPLTFTEIRYCLSGGSRTVLNGLGKKQIEELKERFDKEDKLKTLIKEKHITPNNNISSPYLADILKKLLRLGLIERDIETKKRRGRPRKKKRKKIYHYYLTEYIREFLIKNAIFEYLNSIDTSEFFDFTTTIVGVNFSEIFGYAAEVNDPAAEEDLHILKEYLTSIDNIFCEIARIGKKYSSKRLGLIIRGNMDIK